MAQPPESEPGTASAREHATVYETGPTPGPTSSQSIEAHVGKVLDGRYLIEEPIGAGGMGVVYRGKHQVIGKKVAIKILRGEMAADHEMTERFLNEARAASSIGNPHIVDISDFGRVDDGSAYFVMEYLEGQSLMNLMQSLRVIPVGRLIHIARQIARALAAAHDRGIVHRDLKPDNVMLIKRGDDNDFVKILDFGIAKVGQATSRLTKAGSVFGTPHYMSPEQAAGTEVTAATDIYSLGVILYEMAAGKVPFDADNFMGILTQHMYKSPVYLRTLVPQPQEIPIAMEAIVHKCLAKKPEQRYASMNELVSDLDVADKGQIPEAVQELMSRSGGFNVPADYFRVPERHGGAMIPATPFHRRKPVLVTVLVSACAIFAMVGIILVVVAFKSRPANAHAEANADPPPATAPPNASASTAPDKPAAGKAKVSINVDTIPNAPVWQDDKLLGPFAVLELAPEETARVHVDVPGYKTAYADCKGSVPLCLVKMEKGEKAPVATQPVWTAPVGKKPTTTTPSAKPPSSAGATKTCPKGQHVLMNDCWPDEK